MCLYFEIDLYRSSTFDSCSKTLKFKIVSPFLQDFSKYAPEKQHTLPVFYLLINSEIYMISSLT